MRSPRPSTAFTRRSSSIDVDHGGPSKPSSSPRSNGWTGSTIAGCWNPSATSLQPKLKIATTLYSNRLSWQRDSNQTASGKPGAVHRRESGVGATLTLETTTMTDDMIALRELPYDAQPTSITALHQAY